MGTIKALEMKLGKEKSETHTMLAELGNEVNQEMEKLKGVMGKMENANNNKLGQMQKMMQENSKKLVE